MIIYLTKINPQRNMRHYYLATVQPTFLGEHCLVRIHGRIGRSERVLPPVPYVTAKSAQIALERLVARKKRRGYTDQNKLSG